MTKEELLKLADLPKKERIATVNSLMSEGKISQQDYYEVLRPAIEAKRGIVRDVNAFYEAGKIVHSKEKLQSIIKALEAKKTECEKRIVKATAKINKYKSELKKAK